MKDKLLIWLIGVGLVIAYIGIKSKNPVVIGLLIGGIGIYGIFSGIQMIISKRADIPTSSGASAHVEQHKGISAQIWGILFVVFGALLVLIALAMTVFQDSSRTWIEDFFSASSGFGWSMVVAGAILLLLGIMRLISGNAPYAETKLIPFERVVGGMYFLLIGLGLIGIGAWLIISPSTLKTLINDLVSLIGKLIAG